MDNIEDIVERVEPTKDRSSLTAFKILCGSYFATGITAASALAEKFNRVDVPYLPSGSAVAALALFLLGYAYLIIPRGNKGYKKL